MKNEKLQPSEALAKHFALYREEAPLLSAPEIEKLVAKRDMLPNNHPPAPSFFRRGSKFNVRRIIMTLSGITGLGLAAYLAFFSASHGTNGTDQTDQSYAAHPSHFAQAKLPQLAQPASIPAKNAPQPHANPATRGPWSAGNDQIYADLTREELARLGIVVRNDSVLSYKLNKKDSVECTELSQFTIKGIKYKGHSIGGMGIKALAPLGVNAPRFYPILMTFSNGNGAAYRIEDGKGSEIGMIGPEDAQKDFRAWLETPGTPGLHALGFTTSCYTSSPCKNCPAIVIDTVKIMIGKDLTPSPFPLMAPDIDGLSGTLKQAFLQLAHFYDGSNSIKPLFAWPKTLTIKVDTFTARNLLDQMNEEENSSSMQHLRSIMAHLNELVPVIVRIKPGTGAPGPNDFIFWYEPSEELFNALPPVQATLFRAKLNELPHCMTAPNAVMTSAEVTYCETKPQEVQVTVQDLTGKTFLIMSQSAIAGDNVLDFTTATLPSGMYILTVRDREDTLRSQRLWVENAHPKLPKEIAWRNLPHAPDEMIFVNNGGSVPLNPTSLHDDTTGMEPVGIPKIPMVELTDEPLANLGITSNSWMVTYYLSSDEPGKILSVGILRSWGAQMRTIDSDDVHVRISEIRPRLITDAIGRKRLVTNFGAGPWNSKTLAQDAEKATHEIDRLVPILFRASNTSDSIGARDLIFWYQPTPAFLAALPDSARAIAEQMINGMGNGNESIAMVHGAIEQAIAYPNPSRGRFTLKLSVKGERSLTFTLRNLLGQPVAPPTEARVKGEGEQPLDFGTIPEGVYLLDITSSHGERYLQRIVIAR